MENSECLRGQKPDSAIEFNIAGSNIGVININSIVGNIDAVVNTLQQQGSGEIAIALKTLADAIAGAKVLEGTRKELLENVEAISEQAERPRASRKLGIVRASLRYIEGALAVSADLTTLWTTYAPAILKHFGIQV